MRDSLWVSHMDIVRPSNARRKRLRRILYGAIALLAVLLITLGLSRLKPAAPGVERVTLWVDTVKRGPLLRELCEATGLIAEVRHEGIALVDDTGDLTDLELSHRGPESHQTLLLVQWFAECLKVRREGSISISEVEERVRDLIRVHGSEWRRDVREAGMEARIFEDALLRIRALRLVRISADGITPLPASCRYASSEQN